MDMLEYETRDINERKLEDMVRRAPHLIEGSLKFVDHQKRTPRRPLDVLLVDSGRALVVAELKTVEDDGMLMQALDYFDYVSTNLEGFVRIYKQSNIDVIQLPRLFLIAPSFSQTLLNRCKWIDTEVKISLFTYKYIITKETKDTKDTIVFMETGIPFRTKREEEYSIPKLLDYIKDEVARKDAEKFLEEVKSFNPKAVEIAPKKNKVVVNISGSKIAKKIIELWPGRKHWEIDILDLGENKWRIFKIHAGDDYSEVISLLKKDFEEAKVDFIKLEES
jgi:hypothetical protein